MNFLKTGMLLAALMALFGMIGLMLGGVTGMVLALGFGVMTNVFTYWNADKIVLKMYRAEEVDENHGSGAVRRYVVMTRQLAVNANMPLPKIYIIENDQPNAFATGRNPENAAVAATTGLLSMLNEREIAGVMAHELAHVKNRDTLTMTITATIAGAITTLANFAMFFGGNRNHGGLVGSLAIMFLAPMAASLVQMAISRSREYEADRIGAQISGDPEGLASALARISHGAARIPNEQAERHPETGQLMIINPLSGGGRGDKLFSTHPATQNRIDRLMALSQSNGSQASSMTSVPQSGSFNDAPKGSRGPWG